MADIISFPLKPKPRPIEGWWEAEYKAAMERALRPRQAEKPSDTEPA